MLKRVTFLTLYTFWAASTNHRETRASYLYIWIKGPLLLMVVVCRPYKPARYDASKRVSQTLLCSLNLSKCRGTFCEFVGRRGASLSLYDDFLFFLQWRKYCICIREKEARVDIASSTNAICMRLKVHNVYEARARKEMNFWSSGKTRVHKSDKATINVTYFLIVLLINCWRRLIYVYCG